MADTSQYILSFNFDEVSGQIDRVGRSYTELGATIRGISRDAQSDVDNLKQKLSGVTASLSVLTSTLDLTFSTLRRNLTETSYLVEDIAKHSKTISENFANLPGSLPTAGIDKSTDTVGERVGDVSPGVMFFGAGGDAGVDEETAGAFEALRKESDDTIEHIKAQLEALDKAKENTKEELGKLGNLVVSEAKNAKSGVMSFVSRGTMGVVGGGLLAGAITSMVLGFRETDRQRAERGEVKNVLEATGEQLFSGPVKKASRWFSNFQEHAQFYWGVGRKEIQATVKQMVDAGYSATEIMESFDKTLGKVGKNTATLALGLDKHLNLASGESMKKIITLTQEYGDSLKDASSNVLNLSLSAQQSGAGISRFIDSVMSGSSALAQYGIDLKEVVGLTSKLEDHYTNMGLDKRYAGQLATSAASGLASGISNFQVGTKMLMASKMGLGEGYEGLMGLEEGWKRVQRGEKTSFFVQMLDSMRQIQEENVGGASREVKIAFWKQQGLSTTAASSFVDQAAKGSFDKLLENTEGSKKELEGLKKAFQTEGEQVSEIQKDQRDIIKDLQNLGQGLLMIAGNLLATVILGFRSIPALMEYAVNKLNFGSPDAQKRADRIMDAITTTQSGFFQGVSEGVDRSWKSGGALANTLAGKMVKIFGDSVGKAATVDLSGITDRVDWLKDKIGDIEGDISMLKKWRTLASVNPLNPNDDPTAEYDEEIAELRKEQDKHLIDLEYEQMDRRIARKRRQQRKLDDANFSKGAVSDDAALQAGELYVSPSVSIPGEVITASVNASAESQSSGMGE